MTEFLQNYVSFSKPLNRDEQKTRIGFETMDTHALVRDSKSSFFLQI
jgi:hypothetical protein